MDEPIWESLRKEFDLVRKSRMIIVPDARLSGQNLRLLREKKAMTQTELAYLSKVNKRTISNWELGISLPRQKSLASVMGALKISPADLWRAVPTDEKARTQNGFGIRSRRQVIFYSRLVIFSLEDALEQVNDKRLHNNPPSDLIIDDDQYLKELRNIVSELKRLNSLLETKRLPRSATRKPVVEVKKHINTFLQKWAATVGIGAGVMTVGAMAALLHQLGASDAIFDQLQKRLPLR